MSALAPGVPSATARRRPFERNWVAWFGWLALAAYVVYAASLLDLRWARLVLGLGEGARLIDRLFPPDFTNWRPLVKGLVESLQIAVLASALGIVLSLPIGFLAARNLMPPWVTWPVRGLIAVCRSFHPLIVAILFVKAVGFGALAGILALVVASVGFIAKLFAEAIEEVSPRQMEAVRACGASFANVILFGVVPQVLPRFVGLASYQFDSNLRNSVLVGIVGGGGIGATLFSAFQRFDYAFVMAILLSIIALIMLTELASQRVRNVLQ